MARNRDVGVDGCKQISTTQRKGDTAECPVPDDPMSLLTRLLLPSVSETTIGTTACVHSEVHRLWELNLRPQAYCGELDVVLIDEVRVSGSKRQVDVQIERQVA